jgi:GPH family glycoside/pentoside/hexuronide:cation symporter
MLVYSLGECANSLVMNGVYGFAMLFFTKALGLEPGWAGAAMAVSVVWEAVFEPVVGYASDHTRSRWGRRHPYMLAGGLMMAACSYLIWYVPEAFRVNPRLCLTYIIAVNLLLRTGLTLFLIPYMALGFEMCADYQGRAKLQSFRQIFNMAANFAGPALAWWVFFGDRDGVPGTLVPGNYRSMGAVFSAATAVFVVATVVFTYRFHERAVPDSEPRAGRWKQRFLRDLLAILGGQRARWVFLFAFIVCSGMVLVSSLQIFVYDDYMRFSPREKSIAHGSTMAGMALGAFMAVGLSRRLDKRNTVLLGGWVSVLACLALGLCFLTGWVPVGSTPGQGGKSSLAAFCLFVPFHAAYWLGNGVMLPIANAMVADLSEMHCCRAGVKADGEYSAILSLSMRAAVSLSLFVSGYALGGIGFQAPAGVDVARQSPAVLWRLGALTFWAGGIICLVSLAAISRYSLTRGELEEVRRSALEKGNR